MSVWFARTGGSNANSGGGDTDAADIADEGGTNFVVAGGTGLTYAPGGLSALPANADGPTGYTRSVNLNIGGTRTIRKITVLTDTTATLNAAVADGSYGGSVGGARVSINNLVGNGAGENTQLAASDSVFLQENATFTEANINFDVPIKFSMRGATIDGTGGGAGSDVLKASTINGHFIIGPGTLANAVDRGYDGGDGTNFRMARVKIVTTGGIGVSIAASGGNKDLSFVSVRSAGSTGFSGTTNDNRFHYCEAIDGAAAGFGIRAVDMTHCLAADNGGDGFNSAVALTVFMHNTFEGNTGDGAELATTSQAAGLVFMHNVFSNNGGYGVNASGGAITTVYDTDYNLYWNNNGGGAGLDRNNFNSGAHDLDADPLWISAASDNYTPGPGSPLLNAGYDPWKASADPTIGAVGASATESADFPSEDDVRDGTSYADGTMEGNLVLPAEDEVEAGVGFGSNGTEFEGTLSASGGGGGGIFPSQMRGGPGSRT